MKALVTGARGFIGSFLVEHLIDKGFEVDCLLRQKGAGLGWLAGLEFRTIEGDIVEKEALNEAAADADYVFHLAAVTKAHRREDFDRVNVEGTRRLLEAIREINPGVKKFVLISSLAAAGPSRNGKPLTERDTPRPISQYGCSKLKAEAISLKFAEQVPVCIIRPPAVYGPRDKDIYNLFRYTKQGWRPVVGGGPRYASVIYVRDLVRGMVLAATSHKSKSQIYYLCNDTYCSWETIENMVGEMMGKSPRRVPIPMSLAYIVSAGFDFYGKLTRQATLFNLDKYRELKATHWICDNSKAKKELGFETRHSLEDGLRKTLDWYAENGWI